MQLNYIATVAAAILAASSQAAPLSERTVNQQLDTRDVIGAQFAGSSQTAFSARSREENAGDASVLKNLARRALGTEERSEAQHGAQHRFHAVRRSKQCKAKTSSSPSASSTKAASSSSTKAASSSSSSASKASTQSASKTSSSVNTSATSSSVKTSSSRGITSFKNKGGLTGGYYPEWVADSFPPENIYWPQFDYVAYAFSTVSNNAVKIDNTALLKRFVAAAHGGNTKAILSIGGWGQSGGFSDAVLTDTSRNTFATSVNSVLKAYNLDGVDFDWEYPGNVQGGTSRPYDTKNFQTFLQTMRSKMGDSKIMSVAAPQQVWQGSDGNPVGSVARAGGALDYLMLMNYDVWGSSSNPGPNAPLANFCGNSTQPVASAAGGVKAWTDAGFPREKIILGVPGYGYINTSKNKALRQRSLAGQTAERDEFPLKVNTHQMSRRSGSGLTSMDGTSGSGQINFNALVGQGALKYDSSRKEYVQAGDWVKYWDDCSDTPYLSNGNYVVTYDDPDSLYDKADFAHLAGIAGVSMWSIDSDTTSRALFKGLIAGLAASS